MFKLARLINGTRKGAKRRWSRMPPTSAPFASQRLAALSRPALKGVVLHPCARDPRYLMRNDLVVYLSQLTTPQQLTDCSVQIHKDPSLQRTEEEFLLRRCQLRFGDDA